MTRPVRLMTSLAWWGCWVSLLAAHGAEVPSTPPSVTALIHPAQASFLEQLALREIRRYHYLRTGSLLPMQTNLPAAPVDPEQGIILVGARPHPRVQQILAEAGCAGAAAALEPQHYWLKTIRGNPQPTLLVIGGDDLGTLYGAYRLAEHWGVRFYLHGDVIPDERLPSAWLDLDETGRPLFELRGIQPFHDFPEGPDWWSQQAYQAVLAQLPKLGMNFFGLHTYPEGGVGPEPLTWIGLPEEIGPGSKVRASYPARHFTTLNAPSPGSPPAWGYRPTPTGDFSYGADALFDRDDHGPDYMRGLHPWTALSAERSNELFANMGAFLEKTFSLARRLGIKTCLGTETPLIMPGAVQQRLRQAGRDPGEAETIRKVYEGIFQRIQQVHALDYYWLWTPEGWTWQEVQPPHILATLADLKLASEAARNVKAPFQLATCGWVLGPPQKPSLFDEVLPKDWPMSCINRNVGFDPVEPGFAQVQGRPKWAIPWLEDDPAMILPQLWVGRLRKDAADALRYGCTGLMGIHWRTRILGPNVAALARAAWDQTTWKTLSVDQPAPSAPGSPEERRHRFQPARHAPCADFYLDWATAEFGPAAAADIAALFSSLDGRLPRPSTWVHGPGGIFPDPRLWREIEPTYRFVEQLAALRPQIQGPGHLERFDYWLENFRYLRAVGEMGYLWSQLNKALEVTESAPAGPERKTLAQQLALPLRRDLVGHLQEVHRHLLATVSTPGALGTVANWQQHVMPLLLTNSEARLTRALQVEQLPASALPSPSFPGQPRLIVPVAPTLLMEQENLQITALVLGTRPDTVTLHWKPLGQAMPQTVPLRHASRGVYEAVLPYGQISSDFEYYLTARFGDTNRVFPATAPSLNQTVIVMRAPPP